MNRTTVFSAILSLLFLPTQNAVGAKSSSRTEKLFRGSVLAPQSSRMYSRAAKISMEEAIDISKRELKGHLVSSDLESEKGYLVYAVNIEVQDQMFEVLVDAGNGKVLSKNREGAE
jgi:uncharacterized membrane protein YkoI